MGHSSYFLQIEGKKILVDPVFSGSVSPLKITNKAFDGTDIYTANDIPELDYLVITTIIGIIWTTKRLLKFVQK